MKNAYEIRGDTTAIFVTRRNGDRFEFYIDTSDLELVKTLSNTYTVGECTTVIGKYYVKGYRRVRTGKYIKPYLHRLLLDPPDGMVVDHIDGNPLNNRRNNLRVGTASENLQNRKGAMTNSETGVRGVFKRKDCDLWEAQVVVMRKKYRSTHKTKEDAEAAVKEMRRRLLPFSDDASDEAC